jgi:hypothetical protein
MRGNAHPLETLSKSMTELARVVRESFLVFYVASIGVVPTELNEQLSKRLQELISDGS